jgi:hypothetical protein
MTPYGTGFKLQATVVAYSLDQLCNVRKSSDKIQDLGFRELYMYAATGYR